MRIKKIQKEYSTIFFDGMTIYIYNIFVYRCVNITDSIFEIVTLLQKMRRGGIVRVTVRLIQCWRVRSFNDCYQKYRVQ